MNKITTKKQKHTIKKTNNKHEQEQKQQTRTQTNKSKQELHTQQKNNTIIKNTIITISRTTKHKNKDKTKT